MANPPGYHLLLDRRDFRLYAGSPMAEMRVSFLKVVLEILERVAGAQLIERALGSPGPGGLELGQIRQGTVSDTVPLDQAEEFLLRADNALGGGSGRTLEMIGREIATQRLASASRVVSGDLSSTLERLKVPFMHPFSGLDVQIKVMPTPGGVSLDILVPQRTRSARILRFFMQGAAEAGQRFAREGAEQLRMFGDVRGDRTRIDIVLRHQSSPAPPAPVSNRPATRHPAPRRSQARLSLAEEVDAILSSRTPNPRRSLSPIPISRTPSPTPSSRHAVRPPILPEPPAPDESADDNRTTLPGKVDSSE